MTTKIKFGILALKFCILLILPAFAASSAADLSLAGTLKLLIPALAQTSDPPPPEPLVLTDAQDRYPLGLHLEILEDPSGELTIEDVSSPEFDSQFVPNQAAVPTYGFTDNVYWLQLRLDNQTRQTGEWLLEQGFANTHYVDLYTPLPDGEGFSVKQAGILRPVSTRDVLHPRLIFNLEIPPDSQQTYYLRFQSGASMTMPLTLWTQDAFLDRALVEQALMGVIYGVLIGLLFYNLFLFFTLREVNYLLFVILLASLIFEEASYSGYLLIYLIPDLNVPVQYIEPVAFPLLIGSMVLFAASFLELKTRLPKLHMVSLVILIVWGALMLMTPFTSYRFLANLMVPWSSISLSAILLAGTVSWIGGYRPSRFFLLAWLGLIVSLLWLFLVRLGIASSTLLSENAFRIGYLWMAVCWSIALADRFNLLKSEKEQADLELQASETRYRQLVETMNDGLGVIDLDSRFTYVNPRLVEMLGYSPDEIIGHSLTEFIDEDNQQILNSQLVKRKAGLSNPYELTWLKKDGSEMITWMSPMPLYEITGRYQGSFAIITDITERVLATRLLEQRVNERTHELSTLLEISRDISAAKDLNVILNRIMERLRTVANYQGLVILAEQGGNWVTSAQDWPSLSAQPEPIVLSAVEVKAVVKNFAPGSPVLISNSHPDEAKLNGFRNLIARLSSRINSDIHCWIGMPLLEKGNILGALVLGCTQTDATQDQVYIIEAFANQMAIAIENHRLYQQIRAVVMKEERNRLARDLHDSVTQTLFTASILAETTPRLWENNQELALLNMEKLSLLIRGALAEMRSLLLELRSDGLQNQTLRQLVTTLAEAGRARTRAKISVSVKGEYDLPEIVTLIFYYIAQEGLNNAINHGRANQIIISLIQEPDYVELRIQDDGHGFIPQEIPEGHLGINIMLERAAQIGADLRIISKPGEGTEVILTWSEEVALEDYDQTNTD